MSDRLTGEIARGIQSPSSSDGPSNFGYTVGILIEATTVLYRNAGEFMSRLQKALKTGLVTGLCGLGVYAVAKKLNIAERAADLAHSVEAVPFPGANLYEFLTARHMHAMYSEIAQEIASTRHFDQVLDLGTGVGYLPIELTKCDTEAHVFGLDRSADMIHVAKTNAMAETRARKAHFLVGEPMSLPFPGRYFDLITSVISLHHWTNPLTALEEVYYALKPGGEFWIYDYRKEVPEELWTRAESRLPAYLRIPFMVGPVASWKASMSEEAMRKLISQTRFELVDLDLRSLTIFGERMPAFNRIVLRKPLQVRDDH